mgnify:CR=1 FL=1
MSEMGKVITSKKMTAEEYYNLSDDEKANFEDVSFINISEMKLGQLNQKIFTGELISPEYKVCK